MQTFEVSFGGTGDDRDASEVAADVVVEVGGDAFAQFVELSARDQAAAFDDGDGNEKGEPKGNGGSPGGVEFAFGGHAGTSSVEFGEFAFNFRAVGQLVEPGVDWEDLFSAGGPVGEFLDGVFEATVACHDGKIGGEVLAARPDFDFAE